MTEDGKICVHAKFKGEQTFCKGKNSWRGLWIQIIKECIRYHSISFLSFFISPYTIFRLFPILHECRCFVIYLSIMLVEFSVLFHVNIFFFNNGVQEHLRWWPGGAFCSPGRAPPYRPKRQRSSTLHLKKSNLFLKSQSTSTLTRYIQ